MTASGTGARLIRSVEEVCRKQSEIGTDIINDGELGKTSRDRSITDAWSSYAWGHLSGWEPGEPRSAEVCRVLPRARRATSFRSSSSLGGRLPVLTAPHCEAALTPRGPIAYAGQQALSADLANFEAALAKVKATEVMNPSSALSRAHQSIRRLHAIEGGKRLLHFDRRWEIGHAVDD